MARSYISHLLAFPADKFLHGLMDRLRQTRAGEEENELLLLRRP